ncbi:ImpA family type VI secretion system protein [Pseudoalteromonas denitrificans]|uniref:Type VI secretion system protein ImpA n=1 Tax=Pseudoalteromonas denitrificans DSM 6059 TaxID=1123010 RepID=A0A1I1GLJ4_9GAMM|nr:type VI secretion system ImpA family N-terminal domain-containing protein [Pseudoalteromonas denitrificans]SFC12325.1 type VI secretion system protein ImpA [Pseudoalteromonas denitrificans DSM 6059]
MDYKNLLHPIEGDSAVGCYLKDDRSAYRGLRNNFNAAQSSFRRLIETPDSTTDETLFEENQKNWQVVNESCWQTLTEKSKDVEVYCWWVMSLAFQKESISKISSALSVLVEFIETFWPDIQPFLPDNKLKSSEPNEQAAQRAELQLRPLIQLLGESVNSGLLYMPLQMLPLIGEIDHAQYFSATKSGSLAKLKAQAKKDFTTYKSEISITIHALDDALSSINKLDIWLKNTASQLAIPVISAQFIKENLNDCLQAIKYLVLDSYATWPLDVITPSTIIEETAAPEQVQPIEQSNSQQGRTVSIQAEMIKNNEPLTQVSGQLTNRDHAFQELRKIADYFSKTEPHSPVSFILEKAIRWGYMSLPDLMQELVSGNDKVLEQISLVTGINNEKADISAYKAPEPVIQPSAPVTEKKTETVAEVKPVQKKDSNEIPNIENTKNTSTESDFNW